MTTACLGNLYIVAAPSGGGKTSLVKKLIDTLDDIAVSISHTTREKRTGEQEGVDYFYVNESTFLELRKNNAFVESATVFGHYYGTSFAQIQDRLTQGIDMVLDIDWQGALQIRHSFPTSVTIFIIPPSLDALQKRLCNRGRDDAATIANRMHLAQEEMQHYPEFDYLIVNDDFDTAAQALQSIVLANRLRTPHQKCRQQKLLSFLLESR